MMEQIFMLVGRTILVVTLINILFIGCGSDDNDDPKESAHLKRLSGTWHIKQVTLEGTDVTHLFEGVVLTLNTDRTYRVLNGIPPIWPSGGSFTLVEADQPGHYHMVRQDGMEILLRELSDDSVQLNFSYNAPASGRVSSVSGGYEFVFQRQ